VDEGKRVASGVGEFSVSLIGNGDTMRYVVEVDELSPEMLMNLKKNSRVINIFPLINNMIAIETENIERIKELKGVNRVRESSICETHAQPKR
jgi:hypothetical protein